MTRGGQGASLSRFGREGAGASWPPRMGPVLVRTTGSWAGLAFARIRGRVLAERGMAAAELRAQELRADLRRARTGARWGWATAAAGFVLAAGLGGWALERHQRTAAAAGVQAALVADLRDRAERAELLADRLADGLTEGPRTLAGPWAGDSVTIP